MIRVRGWSSIGPAQVIAEQPSNPGDVTPRWRYEEVARLTIPDADLPDVIAVLLQRAFQQNYINPALETAIKQAQECIDARK